jgi:Zn-dependent protease
MGAMAWLQMLSVLFNLVPVPPLDGFGVIGAFMDERTRARFMTPPTSYLLFGALFVVLMSGGVFDYFHSAIERVLQLLGFDGRTIEFFGASYNQALFGRVNPRG